MSGRKFFVGGNWKSNGSKSSIHALVEALNDASLPAPDQAEVVVSPPSLYLDMVNSTIKNNIQVAAQNCWTETSGAFTGEIAAEMVLDLGLRWVILGHSERRSIFGESSDMVAKKTKHALDVGLQVILCVGEQLSEREAGKTKDVIYEQLEAVAKQVKDWNNIVIAYEPVWAIGTGKVASPQQAQDAHADIRHWLASSSRGNATAESVRIIYGGSVKADNSDELARQEDIDGFLVGGASLIPAGFVAIVNSANQKQKK
eukprot:TRINITY_DN720_c0_g1_i5.p1 TRINITY_DN720_c0_g1~~TRINITY_DN720_c0_g1_i5.p1  ORF type:complete len:258 (+),score=71.66 TRINITY_DN720_c0_g1_i5:199-972(+)